MTKKGIICLVGILGLGLVSSHRLEPELRVYPLAMGIDTDGECYQVYYDIPDLSVYTGDGKPMEEGERVWKLEGCDNQEIEAQIVRTKKETPDMGHVQAILLGTDLLEDNEKYKEVLESFVENPMLGSGSYVFVCRDLERVMNTGATQTDSLGEYLVDILDKSPDRRPMILQDLYNAYYNKEAIPRMMEILVQEDKLVIDGLNKL